MNTEVILLSNIFTALSISLLNTSLPGKNKHGSQCKLQPCRIIAPGITDYISCHSACCNKNNLSWGKAVCTESHRVQWRIGWNSLWLRGVVLLQCLTSTNTLSLSLSIKTSASESLPCALAFICPWFAPSTEKTRAMKLKFSLPTSSQEKEVVGLFATAYNNLSCSKISWLDMKASSKRTLSSHDFSSKTQPQTVRLTRKEHLWHLISSETSLKEKPLICMHNIKEQLWIQKISQQKSFSAQPNLLSTKVFPFMWCIKCLANSAVSSLILTVKAPSVIWCAHCIFPVYVSSTCLWLLWFTGLLGHLQSVCIVLLV